MNKLSVKDVLREFEGFSLTSKVLRDWDKYILPQKSTNGYRYYTWNQVDKINSMIFLTRILGRTVSESSVLAEKISKNKLELAEYQSLAYKLDLVNYKLDKFFNDITNK